MTDSMNEAAPVCVICGAAAARIMDGWPYCGRHSNLSARPGDPAAAPCAVCAAPSNRMEYGLPYCGAHTSCDLPPRAA
jgi:endogenous inhibitor of DNA gyrase (YacG/DUF329 family)